MTKKSPLMGRLFVSLIDFESFLCYNIPVLINPMQKGCFSLKYIIYDPEANGYLSGTEKALVDNPKKASKFKSLSTACRFLSDGKMLEERFVIKEYEAGDFTGNDFNPVNKQKIKHNPISENVGKNTDDAIECENIEMVSQSIIDGFESVLDWMTKASEVAPKLGSSLSKIDREISDIYHTIEFSNFSASDGYKLAKLMQDTLLRRRNIKNMMALTPTIQASLNSFKNSYKSIDSPKYTYRERPDISPTGKRIVKTENKLSK